MRAAANGFRAVILPAALIVAASACGDVRSAPTEDTSPEQPLAFMHNVHVQDNRIPCAYCHFSTNTSEDAGIPAVETCMGCHRFVQGTSPEFQQQIQILMGFWADSIAIPWARVYSVPEFVQFTHPFSIGQVRHQQIDRLWQRSKQVPLQKGDAIGQAVSGDILPGEAPAQGRLFNVGLEGAAAVDDDQRNPRLVYATRRPHVSPIRPTPMEPSVSVVQAPP